MPDFNGEMIDVYDSLNNSNRKILSNSKNLIIDIRNNQGGYTNCFDSLIPYICTHPILSSPSYTLCSQDLIDDAKKERQVYILKKDTALVFFYNKYINKIIVWKYKFMEEPSDTLLCLNNGSLIKNVGMITNYGCRSAAELMILYFQQSSKVKVFGEITGGALDNLDAIKIKLPVSGYTLFIATTKRVISVSQPGYDNVGIKPDVSISDSTANWIDFVKHYYESK